jgi:outer membrane biosynthesis protein TonB
MFRAKAQSFGRELAAHPVARAFAISLLLHFVLISGVEVGRKAGWWKHSLLPQRGKSQLEKEVEKAEELLKKQVEQALSVPEAQLVFVEVDQAAPEPPKETKFYSSQNSIASNPDVAEKEKPKIDGQQDKIVKTFDTLKPDPRALQPKPPEPKQEQKAQPKVETKTPPVKAPPIEDPKPTRQQDPGETLLARAKSQPEQKAQPEVKPEPRRPRTVAEAKLQKGIIEGQKMRQDGGARKHSVGMSMDVKATPFGAYDQLFIEAVQSSWFRLLEERQFMPNDAGKVVVEFRLNYDGRITGLRVVDSEVNDHLAWTCQRAVLDIHPFMPFPSDMRRLVKNDYREIRFTFYYNQ